MYWKGYDWKACTVSRDKGHHLAGELGHGGSGTRLAKHGFEWHKYDGWNCFLSVEGVSARG